MKTRGKSWENFHLLCERESEKDRETNPTMWMTAWLNALNIQKPYHRSSSYVILFCIYTMANTYNFPLLASGHRYGHIPALELFTAAVTIFGI